ncbi:MULTISPECIES: hypothetical protein [unclassified Microcoleus]|uniref:hypothetical protein n=1 Tax=unclassified Microcoleus TaxID=2642155 RepID=UPI002FCF1752
MSVVSCQLSVVSCQLSVVSCQLSVVITPRSQQLTVNSQQSTVNSQQSTVNNSHNRQSCLWKNLWKSCLPFVENFTRSPETAFAQKWAIDRTSFSTSFPQVFITYK